MDASRWERIQTLFHQTADLPPAEQRPFLDANCGGDPELAAAVAGMLTAEARGGSLLDRDVAQVAHQVLGENRGGPSQLGSYRLGKVLGEGGMGAVYLPERDELRSAAAINIFRDAWMSPA